MTKTTKQGLAGNARKNGNKISRKKRERGSRADVLSQDMPPELCLLFVVTLYFVFVVAEREYGDILLFGDFQVLDLLAVDPDDAMVVGLIAFEEQALALVVGLKHNLRSMPFVAAKQSDFG